METFNGREIRLIVYPEPLEVAYQSVFELVPGFKEKYPNVAYFVHLGVHEHAEKFRIERRARKGPYERKDVRGRSFDGPDDDGKWSTLPQELFTGVDVAALVETVKADVNVRYPTTVHIRFLLSCRRQINSKHRMMLASFSASSYITIR